MTSRLELLDSVATALAGQGLDRRTQNVLLAYADRHGKNWKADLMADWRRGTDVSKGDGLEPDGGATLRRLRNTKGPVWLDTLKCLG